MGTGTNSKGDENQRSNFFHINEIDFSLPFLNSPKLPMVILLRFGHSGIIHQYSIQTYVFVRRDSINFQAPRQRILTNKHLRSINVLSDQ